MAEKSAIEWTDASWSPLRARVKEDAAEIARAKGYASLVQIGEKMAGRVGHHCEHVSPECEHCYSEAMQSRCLKANGTGLPFDRRSRDLVDGIVDEKILLQPLKWKQPKRIFVESQGDLFGEWYNFEMIDEVFTAMVAADQHAYQILTKRPLRALEYFASGRHDGGHGPDRSNYHLGGKVWIGVTAGTRKSWDERVPILKQIPAAVRFVSAEPLLEDLGNLDLSGIDWVITGGESGRNARPSHPDWFRSVRDQCVPAGVPYLHKQNGEWSWLHADPGQEDESNPEPYIRLDGQVGSGWVLASDPEVVSNFCGPEPDENSVWIRRVGKKAAGRLLDGVEWSQFPEVQR